MPLPLFPANHWWNTDISAAPVDPGSAGFITFIGPTKGMHPDFGGDAGGGDVYGFPVIQVEGTQAKKAVSFFWPDQSDGVDHTTEASFPFYPVPDEAIAMTGWVEGGQPGAVDQRNDADRHILMVDVTNNRLYELYNVWFNGSSWEAGSGAAFFMNRNDRRPDTWTSADAAGLAILPGLVRHDEVYGPRNDDATLGATGYADYPFVVIERWTCGSCVQVPEPLFSAVPLPRNVIPAPNERLATGTDGTTLLVRRTSGTSALERAKPSSTRAPQAF